METNPNRGDSEDTAFETADLGDTASAISLDTSHGAIRDRLKKLRGERQKKDKVTLLVGGYDRQLGVRYKSLPTEEIAEVAQAMKTDAGQGDAALDMVIRCCDAVMVRENPGDRELRVLVDDNDQPLRFDVRLAEFLGFEAKSAREVAVGVFSPGGTASLAAADHAGTLLNWMTGRDGAIAQELLGE